MKKSLVLHIGTEKTGTTTLQHFIQDNRQAFLESGVYIPQQLGALTGPYRGNHRALATLFMSDENSDDFKSSTKIDSAWKRKKISDLISEFEAIDKPVTIITSEHLSSRLCSNSEISKLSGFLSDYFDEIKIVVYIRRQVEAAVSAYSTSLKSGYNPKVVLSDDKDFIDKYDYYKLCKTWSKHFKNINVRVFDMDLLKNRDICDDFLASSGLHVKECVKSASVNPSINYLGQEFLKAWNQIEPRYKEGRINPKHQRVVEYLEMNCRGVGRLPEVIWAKEWMSNFDFSNKRVLTEFVDEERESLFNDNYSKYPEKNTKYITNLDLLKLSKRVFEDVIL